MPPSIQYVIFSGNDPIVNQFRTGGLGGGSCERSRFGGVGYGGDGSGSGTEIGTRSRSGVWRLETLIAFGMVLLGMDGFIVYKVSILSILVYGR